VRHRPWSDKHYQTFDHLVVQCLSAPVEQDLGRVDEAEAAQPARHDHHGLLHADPLPVGRPDDPDADGSHEGGLPYATPGGDVRLLR
jgi:hypothetical protein